MKLNSTDALAIKSTFNIAKKAMASKIAICNIFNTSSITAILWA